MTMTALSDELAQVRTKKKEFLAQIERIVPWKEWLTLIHDSMADRRGGGDRGSYTSPTLPCGSYPFVNLREANTLLCKLFTSRKSE